MIKIFMILLLSLVSGVYAGEWQTIQTIPLGQEAANFIKKSVPGDVIGITSFRIEGQKISYLDAAGQRIVTYSADRLVNVVNVSFNGLEDFIQINENTWLILANQRILRIQEKSSPELIFRTNNPKEIIRRLNLRNSKILLHSSTQNTFRIDPDSKMIEKNTGLNLNENGIYHIEKKGFTAASVIKNDTELFQIRERDLGTVRVEYVTPDGMLYIYTETIRRHIPLIVNREIRLYNHSGQLTHRIILPENQGNDVFTEYRITDEGEVYFLLSNDSEYRLLKWTPILDQPEITPFPTRFEPADHYNNHIDTQEAPGEAADYSEKGTVTPGEALAIADSYLMHDWSARSVNITNGLITDPGGKPVQSPDWVVVGDNYYFPYRWGGFNTLSSFDSGLLAGLYAGDIATSAVSNYAVGVDCSGFVSRCWKLTSQYSTAMMDDPGGITNLYDSWYDLQPGDAIHKVGHVRMMVQWNNDGTLLLVESTGTGWRVRYYNFTLSDLATYSPRYYIGMTGTPGNVPQPELTSVTAENGNIDIKWRAMSSDEAAGIYLYRKTDGTWNKDSSTLYDARAGELTVEASGTYRITSLSIGDSLTESIPSDGYETNVLYVPQILIVDGFDRYGGTGSWPLPYHDFSSYAADALNLTGISYGTASNDAVLAGEVKLANFEAVIWCLGDESTTDETFSNAEQSLVKEYLQNGGKLWVSGSEIAWDLDYKGSETDKVFINDFLKCDYEADDANNYQITGTQGSVLTGIQCQFDDGTHGIYEEDYPDVLTPASGGQSVLSYGSGQCAGVYYHGIFPGGAIEGDVFCMGFPFETITAAAERQILAESVVDIFGIATPMPVTPHELPREFKILAQYPNPFNNETFIKLQATGNDPLKINIYDIQGRLIKKFTQGVNSNGLQIIPVIFAQEASGAYFYSVSQGQFTVTGSMLYLK